MVKNLPASAGDMDLIPVQEAPTLDRGTKPVRQAAESVLWSLGTALQSPCGTATEASAPSSLCSTREATARRSLHPAVKNSPTPQLEKSPCSKKDPSTAKNKFKNKKRILKKF